jgi:hypothetical protein
MPSVALCWTGARPLVLLFAVLVALSAASGHCAGDPPEVIPAVVLASEQAVRDLAEGSGREFEMVIERVLLQGTGRALAPGSTFSWRSPYETYGGHLVRLPEKELVYLCRLKRSGGSLEVVRMWVLDVRDDPSRSVAVVMDNECAGFADVQKFESLGSAIERTRALVHLSRTAPPTICHLDAAELLLQRVANDDDAKMDLVDALSRIATRPDAPKYVRMRALSAMKTPSMVSPEKDHAQAVMITGRLLEAFHSWPADSPEALDYRESLLGSLALWIRPNARQDPSLAAAFAQFPADLDKYEKALLAARDNRLDRVQRLRSRQLSEFGPLP